MEFIILVISIYLVHYSFLILSSLLEPFYIFIFRDDIDYLIYLDINISKHVIFSLST